MRYTAHLKLGGQVDLELTEGFRQRSIADGWLTDEHGAMVNMEHVSALVPVPPLPAYVIDGEGGRWERQGESDTYRYVAPDGENSLCVLPLEGIEQEYGIVERG